MWARWAVPAQPPVTLPAPTCVLQGGEVVEGAQVGGQQDTQHGDLRDRWTCASGGTLRCGTGGGRLGPTPSPAALGPQHDLHRPPPASGCPPRLPSPPRRGQERTRPPGNARRGALLKQTLHGTEMRTKMTTSALRTRHGASRSRTPGLKPRDPEQAARCLCASVPLAPTRGRRHPRPHGPVWKCGAPAVTGHPPADQRRPG